MNLIEFQQTFNTEEACSHFLAEKRWGKDQKDRYCPHCGSYATYAFKSGVLFKCKDCRKQFTVKIGTVFTGSQIPLTKWFLAIYLATSLKKGISSVQLSKYAGVTQKTSWYMLHRIRYAIETNSDGDPLKGLVEIDETYVGGKAKAFQKVRKPKAVVFGAIERGGRIRVSHVKTSGSRVLLPKINKTIAKGSTIYSDQWGAYRNLPQLGYTHFSVNHSKLEFVSGLVHTQNIETAWSHFKRSIIGVYHVVSLKHLQKYCSEFEYRYNTRTINDGERFNGWFGFVHATISYKELISGRK